MTATVYQPKPGDRVRVTRYVGGKVRFSKAGVIVEACLPYGFRFKEDEGGMRFLAGSEQVAGVPGWSQTIEPLLS